jgi:cell division protein FtsB
MAGLFVVLFLLSLLCLIVGLSRPDLVIKWGKVEWSKEETQARVFIICGLGAIIFFFLAIVFQIIGEVETGQVTELKKKLELAHSMREEAESIKDKLTEENSRLKEEISRLKEQIKTLTAEVPLPNYIGKNVEEAKSDIESKGWLATVKEQVSEKSPGTIIGQTPPAGTKMKAGAKVELVVAKKPSPGWKTILTFSGTSNKRSDIFELTGAKARLNYTVKGGNWATFSVYVVEEGRSLEKEGGFPEVMTTGPTSDSTFLVNDPGRYYLDVNSANARWTITIQEYR